MSTIWYDERRGAVVTQNADGGTTAWSRDHALELRDWLIDLYKPETTAATDERLPLSDLPDFGQEILTANGEYVRAGVASREDLLSALLRLRAAHEREDELNERWHKTLRAVRL